MKVCTKCGEHKSLEDFSPRKGRKTKHQSACKSCMNAATKVRREAFPERVKAERLKFYCNNKESEAVRTANYKAKNLDRQAAWASKRRAKKLNATPNWLTQENYEQIRLIYAHAKECEMLTGDKYHVDHIVPLQGKSICGLHVPWNLQVLPADINLTKSNKHHG